MQRVWALLFVVACADPPPPPPTDPADLLGTWRYLPADPRRISVEDRQLITFAADGSCAIVEPSGTQTGAFGLRDRELTITMADGWVRTGVAATADHLVIDALFPAAGTTGVVGTWTGAQASQVATTSITLELHADGSARLAQTGTLAGDDTATWVALDGFAVLTFASPTRSRAFPVLPGLALGEWLYERVE